MPYLKIQTNTPLTAEATKTLLAKASRAVASLLGKPEDYVMVALEPPMPMLFAGSDAPLAYLELKSIGLPEAKTAALSKALCELMEQETGVKKERVYIEFANAKGSLWGWNGGTF
ncbi:MAG: phenylpyruvate tautomerase MIF-related protein [Proteobacteria bacterium]|nr:phenylpyruvate tautomerase MIF-related protein [Pseudomonadota bacterium]